MWCVIDFDVKCHGQLRGLLSRISNKFCGPITWGITWLQLTCYVCSDQSVAVRSHVHRFISNFANLYMSVWRVSLTSHQRISRQVNRKNVTIHCTRFPIRSWAGFWDDGLGNSSDWSSGWLAVSVASYCPSMSSQCTEENKQNLAHERMGNLVETGYKVNSVTV